MPSDGDQYFRFLLDGKQLNPPHPILWFEDLYETTARNERGFRTRQVSLDTRLQNSRNANGVDQQHPQRKKWIQWRIEQKRLELVAERLKLRRVLHCIGSKRHEEEAYMKAERDAEMAKAENSGKVEDWQIGDRSKHEGREA